MKILPSIKDLPVVGNGTTHARRWSAVYAAASAARGRWVPVEGLTARERIQLGNAVRCMKRHGYELRTILAVVYVRRGQTVPWGMGKE